MCLIQGFVCGERSSSRALLVLIVERTKFDFSRPRKVEPPLESSTFSRLQKVEHFGPYSFLTEGATPLLRNLNLRGRTVRCASAVRKVGCFSPPVAMGPRVLNSAPFSPC